MRVLVALLLLLPVMLDAAPVVRPPGAGGSASSFRVTQADRNPAQGDACSTSDRWINTSTLIEFIAIGCDDGAENWQNLSGPGSFTELDTADTVQQRGGRIESSNATQANPRCIGSTNTMNKCEYVDGGQLIIRRRDANGNQVGVTENMAAGVEFEWLKEGAECVKISGEAGLTLHGDCKPSGVATTVLSNVAAASDNQPFTAFPFAVTITGIWCHYNGSAPVTAATFTLADGAGNAMTITDTNPACAAPGTAATPKAVTAGGSLTAYELFRVSVSNTPDPATDTYTIGVSFTKD